MHLNETLKQLRSTCLVFLFLLSTLNLSAQHPAYAIAGVPDPVYDYILPTTAASGYTTFPDAGYLDTLHWVLLNGGPRFTDEYTWMYDNGLLLEWNFFFGMPALPDGSTCEVVGEAGLANPAPTCLSPGDTIDNRLTGWTSTALEISNPGGLNGLCTADTAYFALRYIFNKGPGISDTIYGYYGHSEVHLAALAWQLVDVQDVQENELLITPVPVEDVLQITMPVHLLEFVRFEVYDMQGRLKMETSVDHSSSANYSIQTSNLASGMYVLKATTKSSTMSKKFLRK